MKAWLRREGGVFLVDPKEPRKLEHVEAGIIANAIIVDSLHNLGTGYLN